ncbi:MAG TPA: HD domain-containing protein [Clostridia bacterium]|nr:HD domain-containing protein [Clostridia bacterium]
MEEKRTRLEILKEYIDSELHNVQDSFEKRCSFIHLYGVSMCCTMIAAKRGENIELASMAGMLHDFYLYYNANDTNRVFTDHGRRGAPFVREVLKKLQLTTDEETDIICSGVANHCDKLKADNSFDEVIKDADVLQHCLYDIDFTPNDAYKERYARLIEEFGLFHLVK